ncbi:VF530 family protein [Arenicella sp.]|nr:VF530 family protein [Arenicella sp.]
MINDQQSHPLHGLGLKSLLTELVEHYGWEILAEQINVNCFKANPSINSSHKFLHKTTWAREKIEAFYLYKYKQFPLPDDEQHSLSPRNRSVETTPLFDAPAELALGDPEFFDDPTSGPVFPSKKAVQATRAKVTPPANRSSRRSTASTVDNSAEGSSIKTDTPVKTDTPAKLSDASKEKSASTDPWAKWRE